jgi:hypothetical protein
VETALLLLLARISKKEKITMGSLRQFAQKNFL